MIKLGLCPSVLNTKTNACFAYNKYIKFSAPRHYLKSLYLPEYKCFVQDV